MSSAISSEPVKLVDELMILILKNVAIKPISNYWPIIATSFWCAKMPTCSSLHTEFKWNHSRDANLQSVTSTPCRDLKYICLWIFHTIHKNLYHTQVSNAITINIAALCWKITRVKIHAVIKQSPKIKKYYKIIKQNWHHSCFYIFFLNYTI